MKDIKMFDLHLIISEKLKKNRTIISYNGRLQLCLAKNTLPM